MTQTWLVQMRNNHPELTVMELDTLCKASKIQFREIDLRLYELTCSLDEMETILAFSSTIRLVLSEWTVIPTSMLTMEEIRKIEPKIKTIRKPKDNFVVRCIRVGEKQSIMNRQQIERHLGGLITSIYSHLQVNLKNPKDIVQIITYPENSYLGYFYQDNPFADIDRKAPRNLPYFGGGAMKPMLSRICVNLLQPLAAIVMDPFCGHGGMLREIAEMGSYALGFELSYKRAREAHFNNRHCKLEDTICVIVGDSLHPPLRKQAISQVVTDPPYALQTTTRGQDPGELVNVWITTLDLRNNICKIVMTAPDTMQILIPNGWELEIEAKDYVHRTLTRTIRRLVKSS